MHRNPARVRPWTNWLNLLQLVFFLDLRRERAEKAGSFFNLLGRLMAELRVVFIIDSLKLRWCGAVLLRWAGWCREEGLQVLVITRHGPGVMPIQFRGGTLGGARPIRSLERLGWFAFPWRLLVLRQLLRRYRSDVVVGVTTLPAVKLLLASAGLSLHRLSLSLQLSAGQASFLVWRWLRRFTYPWADLRLVQTAPAGIWLRDHCG